MMSSQTESSSPQVFAMQAHVKISTSISIKEQLDTTPTQTTFSHTRHTTQSSTRNDKPNKEDKNIRIIQINIEELKTSCTHFKT